MTDETKKPLLTTSINSDSKFIEDGRAKNGDEEKPIIKKELNKYTTLYNSKQSYNFGLFTSVRWYEYIILVFGFAASFVLGAVPLAFYYFFGKLINHANQHDIDHKITITSYYFFIIAGAAGVATLVQKSVFTVVGEQVSTRIRTDFFAAISKQDMSFFDDSHGEETGKGRILTRLSEDCMTVAQAFSEKIGTLAMVVLQFAGGLAVAMYISWKMSLVMLGTAPILAVAFSLMMYFTVKLKTEHSNALAAATQIADESLSAWDTVKSFAAEEREAKRYCNAVQSILWVGYKQSFLQGMTGGIVSAAIWGAVGLAFWFGGILVGKGQLKLGDVVTVFGMMLFAVMGLAQVGPSLTDAFKAKASLQLLRELANRQPHVNYSGGDRIGGAGIVGRVTFKNVTFTYPSRLDALVIDRMNFNIAPGETIALVGQSGSGKSTVFNLLERFYDPDSGVISIDGKDLASLDPLWYHKNVAIVSQEPCLFSGTIAENIRYGNLRSSDEQVIEAAKMANAHDFIISLPAGYNTEVGEGGKLLSGGQKQRVAIARAVLKDPKILLLDEATSSLDSKSEQLVQEALDKLMVGRTSLLIAHRLSTVTKADSIYVIDQGRIVERGTHAELIQLNGYYKKLAKKQLVLGQNELDSEDEELES